MEEGVWIVLGQSVKKPRLCSNQQDETSKKQQLSAPVVRNRTSPHGSGPPSTISWCPRLSKIPGCQTLSSLACKPTTNCSPGGCSRKIGHQTNLTSVAVDAEQLLQVYRSHGKEAEQPPLPCWMRDRTRQALSSNRKG